MRSTAEIHIIITGIVNRDGLVLRKLLDQLELELLILEDLLRLGLRNFLPCPRLTTLDDLTHLVLDGLEVLLTDALALRQYEIIVAAVLDLRSDTVLYFLTVDLDHCLCEDVCEGMTIHL